MGRPKGEYVNRGTHSLNEDRKNVSGQMRSKATVKRLKMYRNSKERRNAIGKIVKEAPFQSTAPSGKMARIEPNRRWFGNTRVISEKDLFKFQEYENTYDPFQVTLRKTIVPISLNAHKIKKNKPKFTTLEPYFKRKIKVNPANIKANTFEELHAQTTAALQEYHLKQAELQANEDKDEATHGVFRAGTSNRIWMEVYKVIDSSDVLLYVLDARNPMGMRSTKIENDIRNKQKKLIFILNKVDLVPTSITRHWEAQLNKEYPTILFYADIKHPLGKENLISLLRQFRDKMKDRRQISVGIIGFPNTGKSSLINTLKGDKVCRVAPIAGETKVWQYITLMKSINLIDCPGTVTNEKDDKLSETDLILRNSVRVERVEDPDRHIPAVLNIVSRDVINLQYKVTKPWTDSEQFLEIVARNRGRLLKGGAPDIMTVSKEILKDFNTGKLLWHVKPEGYVSSRDITIDSYNNKDDLKILAKEEEAKVKEIEKELKKAGDMEKDHEDGDHDNDDSGDEVCEDIEEMPTRKKPAVDKTKCQKKPKEAPIKKLTSKQRRAQERQNKSKHIGDKYYDAVDLKMRRTKF